MKWNCSFFEKMQLTGWWWTFDNLQDIDRYAKIGREGVIIIWYLTGGDKDSGKQRNGRIGGRGSRLGSPTLSRTLLSLSFSFFQYLSSSSSSYFSSSCFSFPSFSFSWYLLSVPPCPPPIRILPASYPPLPAPPSQHPHQLIFTCESYVNCLLASSLGITLIHFLFSQPCLYFALFTWLCLFWFPTLLALNCFIYFDWLLLLYFFPLLCLLRFDSFNC